MTCVKRCIENEIVKKEIDQDAGEGEGERGEGRGEGRGERGEGGGGKREREEGRGEREGRKGEGGGEGRGDTAVYTLGLLNLANYKGSCAPAIQCLPLSLLSMPPRAERVVASQIKSTSLFCWIKWIKTRGGGREEGSVCMLERKGKGGGR